MYGLWQAGYHATLVPVRWRQEFIVRTSAPLRPVCRDLLAGVWNRFVCSQHLQAAIAGLPMDNLGASKSPAYYYPRQWWAPLACRVACNTVAPLHRAPGYRGPCTQAMVTSLTLTSLWNVLIYPGSVWANLPRINSYSCGLWKSLTVLMLSGETCSPGARMRGDEGR